jgi:zinc D-Ala-D-Ala carboxypeptidase
VNIIQPLRNVFGGIRITSGYRSLQLNRELKSSDSSNHRYGYAADIEPTNPSVKLVTILDYIHQNFKYKELIAEYFPDG